MISANGEGIGVVEDAADAVANQPPEAQQQTIPDAVTLAIVPHEAPGDSPELARRPRVRVLGSRVEFLGDWTLEQWREFLRAWQKGGDLFHIGLANIIEYGKEKFGEEKVDETLELFGFDMADVLKAHAIGQLSLDIFDNNLTSEHYYVLSKSLPGGKKEQAKWAALADKEHLTAAELKASIEKGKVVRQSQIESTRGSDSGVPNIEGLSLVFQRWTKQAGGEENILKQPPDWKRKFLDEVHPIVELAEKVESTLPDEPAETEQS